MVKGDRCLWLSTFFVCGRFSWVGVFVALCFFALTDLERIRWCWILDQTRWCWIGVFLDGRIGLDVLDVLGCARFGWSGFE